MSPGAYSPLPGAVRSLYLSAELQALLEGLPATQEVSPVNTADKMPSPALPTQWSQKCENGLPFKQIKTNVQRGKNVYRAIGHRRDKQPVNVQRKQKGKQTLEVKTTLEVALKTIKATDNKTTLVSRAWTNHIK